MTSSVYTPSGGDVLEDKRVHRSQPEPVARGAAAEQ